MAARGGGESGRIIAINYDPKAPIFDIAHYGIVGDLNDVIPRMIEINRRQSAHGVDVPRPRCIGVVPG